MSQHDPSAEGIAPEVAYLCIRGADGTVRDVEITPGVYSLGTDEDNRVVLSGEDIAWRHAVLSFFADGLWIEDLGTASGTFLGSERVEGRVQWAPDGHVRIGEYSLTIVAKPVKADVAPLPPPPAPAPEVPRPAVVLAPAARPTHARLAQKQTIKAQIQEELMKRLDIPRLTADHVGESDLHRRVRSTLERIVGDASNRLPDDMDPAALIKELYDETVRLGPLEDLLADPEITEVMVNGPEQVFVEKEGKLSLTDKTFLDANSVLAVIERIVAPIGRRIDESQPYVDARLPDGSRVNAIISPLSLSGPCLTIRKFSKEPLEISDLIGFGTLTGSIATFINATVQLRKNLLVSGGTGSGKTTMLNVLSSFIPATERIITIEDAAELRLSQEHVIRLESRPPNIEGRGAVAIRDLVRNALRMRPDRIIVGECRGGEALDMLQAMNTGHEGSLTTVHANSPRDAIARLETMVLMSGMDLPMRAIREQIGSAIHLIVHTSRYSDGTRKVARIAEVVGLEGERITMQDIFLFEQTGVDAEGRVLGQFVPTGSVPTFLEEMKTRGITLDHGIFDSSLSHDR